MAKLTVSKLSRESKASRPTIYKLEKELGIVRVDRVYNPKDYQTMLKHLSTKKQVIPSVERNVQDDDVGMTYDHLDKASATSYKRMEDFKNQYDMNIVLINSLTNEIVNLSGQKDATALLVRLNESLGKVQLRNLNISKHINELEKELMLTEENEQASPFD